MIGIRYSPLLMIQCNCTMYALQCFDLVGLASGRASTL